MVGVVDRLARFAGWERAASFNSSGEKCLRGAEDDRWEQVEGGSLCNWRSCSTCALLNSVDALVCEMCGASVEFSSPRQANASDQCLVDLPSVGIHLTPLAEIVVADTYLSASESLEYWSQASQSEGEMVHEDSDQGAFPPIGTQVEVLHGHRGDRYMEMGSIPDPLIGTLDEAPAVGTHVKILQGDGRWSPAQIVEVSGEAAMAAKVVYENGLMGSVHFIIDAVRSIDFEDDMEPDDESLGCAVDDPEKDHETNKGRVRKGSDAGSSTNSPSDDDVEESYYKGDFWEEYDFVHV